MVESSVRSVGVARLICPPSHSVPVNEASANDYQPEEPEQESLKRDPPGGGAFCVICDKFISRRGDMPRHRRTHLPVRDKFKLMHRCPFTGCRYQNLQKSNVDTHIRTHTGDKTQACPDCDFRTADPGSLTRHRKRIHDYVPRSRKSPQ
ncbi:hypothetical protein C8J56DRAFT_1053613 [Mycena floridula]|nr:hypothetical protein C8J56DRAFT_1053613 [Mycena floridula]